jgi:hypothetical protein
MIDCEMLPSCPFFNETLPNMPAMAEYLKTLYCRIDFNKCARYMVRQALGKEKVPIDLFPDELERAKRLIAMAR